MPAIDGLFLVILPSCLVADTNNMLGVTLDPPLAADFHTDVNTASLQRGAGPAILGLCFHHRAYYITLPSTLSHHYGDLRTDRGRQYTVPKRVHSIRNWRLDWCLVVRMRTRSNYYGINDNFKHRE